MPTGVITVSQYTANPPQQIDVNSLLEVRGFYTRDFISIDGVTPIFGNATSGEQGPYYSTTPTLNGSGEVVVPDHDIQITVGANPTANYFEGLWVDGAFVMWLMPNTQSATGWQIPSVYGDPIAYDKIATYNRAKRLVYPPDTYFTADQVIQEIERLAGNFDYMAVGVNGIGQASFPPVVASAPIVLMENDPRVGSYFNILSYFAATTNTAAQNAVAIGNAITAAAAVGGGLYIPAGTFPVNSITISVPVLFAPGASILQPANAQTITFTKTLVADLSKHFDNALSGQGTISFSGNSVVSTLYPEWWATNTTPGTTDMGAAIRAAYAAAITGNGRTVQFQATTYLTSLSLTVQGYSTIRGMGLGGGSTSGDTIVKYTGTGCWIREPSSTADIGFALLNMQITTTDTSSGSGAILIGDTGGTDFKEDYRFENLRIVGPGPLNAGTVGVTFIQLGTSKIDNVTISNYETDLVMNRTTANKISGVRLASFRYGLLYENTIAAGGLNDHWVNSEFLGPSVGNDGYPIKFDCANVSMVNIYIEANPTAGITVKAAIWYTMNARLIEMSLLHIDYGPSGGGVMTNTLLFDNGHGGNSFSQFSTGGTVPAISAGTLSAAPGDNRERFVNCSPSVYGMLTTALANNYVVVGTLDNNGNFVQRGPFMVYGVTGIFPNTTAAWSGAGITLDSTSGSTPKSATSLYIIAASHTTSATCTYLIDGAGAAGQVVEIITEADSSGTVTVTFGGLFHSSGTQATTASHFSTIVFRSDGVRFLEISRTTNLA